MKVIILRLFFLFIFLGRCSVVNGHLFFVKSLKEAETVWNKIDSNTLVVFDVDEVLIVAEDQAFHAYADPIRLSFYRKVKELMGESKEKKDRIEKILSQMILLPKRVLVEEETPLLIKNLQDRKVKVIALTSCPTGNFGYIERIEDWRVQHLQSLNIDFSLAFPSLQRYVFKNLCVLKEKPAPIFEKGILFSDGYTKGEVLKAFFKKTKFYPSKVIFIDDLFINHDSVKSELETLGIIYEGIHYSGAEKFYKALNEDLILFQLEHLLETEQWLNDKEAEEILKKRAIYGKKE